MKQLPLRTMKTLSTFGRAIMITALIAVMIDIAALIIDYVLYIDSWLFDPGITVSDTLFMVPLFYLIGANLAFMAVMHVLWMRLQKKLAEIQENELRAEREKTVRESVQRIAGLLATHITAHNNEIVQWIQERKSYNRQVPETIERSSRSISTALQALSEIAFIAPYAAPRSKAAGGLDIDDIEKLLQSRCALPAPDVN